MMGLSSFVLLCCASPEATAQIQTAPRSPATAAPPAAGKPPVRPAAPVPSPAKPAQSPAEVRQASQAAQLAEALLRAGQADTASTRRFRPTEIEGLIVDQTITKAGHDFYDLFYGQWEAPPEATDFTVTIREKLARGTSTLISVEVNEAEVLEMPLQPKYDALEAAAQEAVAVALDHVMNYQLVKRQLEGGDMAGSGIF